MSTARYRVGDRVRFDRPGSPLGPVFGTVTAVHNYVNGDCPYAITWVEDLDGTACTHPDNDPRLHSAAATAPAG